MPSDYYEVFGSWREAKRQAFGDPPSRVEPRVSREAIIEMVVHLKIATRAEYLEKRKELPELVCSYHQVRKLFTSWEEVYLAAAERSAEIAFTRYVGLSYRLGRIPTHEDLKKWKVDISPLRRMFGSKKFLDDIAAIMGKSGG